MAASARSCPVCGRDDSRALDAGGSLQRCRGCRAVYWSQAWTLADLRGHYRGYYEGRPHDYDPLTEKRYHAILERFEQLGSVGRLLDVGCGAGHFLAVAETRGWQATGVEVSQSALELLEQVRARRGFRFAVVSGDLREAAFPSSSFAAVTLFEVIEHVRDPVATLREASRLLKDGGLLYLTTPNFNGLTRYLLGRKWRVIAPEHLCLFSLRSIRYCLGVAGFRPVSVRTKNIDIPAILAGWRSRHGRPRPVAGLAEPRCFRETIELVPWLRWLKAAANRVLDLLGLGETLEVLAVKEPSRVGRP